MTITVAQEYIDTGRPCSGGECPIALGLAEAFPRATGLTVDLASARVTVNGRQLVGSLPVEAQKFIHAFDSRSPGLKPFSFEFFPFPEVV